MLIGILLAAATLALAIPSGKNRHIRTRLAASATVFVIYAVLAAIAASGRLDAGAVQQIRTFQPLFIAFGVINLIVAVAINPWRQNRLPDRFPHIVQDSIVAVLFAAAAAVIIRDRALVTTAAGAVVLGLALQDTLGNLIAGLAIQIEKPFRVGEWVNLGGQDGIVSEITWRATKIRTKAGNFVIVPNNTVARDNIVNYSEPTPHSRIEVEIAAGYETAPNVVKETVLEALRGEPLLAADRDPEVLVSDFADSAIKYTVRVWTTDFAADSRVKDRVRTVAYYAFRRRGIMTPYPAQIQMVRDRSDDRFDPEALSRALHDVPIFSPLDDSQRRSLLEAAAARLYGAGDVIVRQGDAGSSMFVILAGDAVVTLDNSHAPVARLGSGDFFGEMSLLTGEPRTATVTAARDCQLIEIAADRFRGIVMTEPVIADLICSAVAARRGQLDERRAASLSEASIDAPRSMVARMRKFLHLSVAALLLTAVIADAADGPPLQLTSPDGRRSVVATQTHGPITLDGALDEEVWRAGAAAVDFVQAEPHEGQPASELTEVRVAFDADALYVGVVCHDQASPAGIIVNDIRKDFSPGEQDSFEMILDTFADRRNGFVFVVNAAGAKSDAQIANEGRDVNTSWDAVWSVATRTGSDGWSAEIRIPFKTLRFESGAGRVWGVNFSRRIRRKNEIDFWSPVPRVYNLYRSSFGGTLAGLPDASQGRNLRIKPFVAADAAREAGADRFARGEHVGVDVKYGVTPSLTLDVTVKPDFAQAEADEQQVNLTQFSLYYPEKREFFLENSGTFYFGDIPRESRLGYARFSPPEEEVLLFFSRRIGLTDAGAAIPIAAGARLTGRAGPYGVGLMTIQTQSIDGRPGDNYTVLRGRRDILNNSDVGAIVLSREAAGANGDFNRVVGADANFRFLRALSVNSFLAKSESPGIDGGQLAAKGSATWNDNFVHAQYSLLTIGDNFRDDIGYIKRTGIRKHFVDFGLRPRPNRLRKYGIRELHPHTRFNVYTDQHNDKVTESNHVALTTYFENGAWFEYALNPRFERIVTPFAIRPDQSFAIGSYKWNEYELQVETNHSRGVSGSAVVTTGGFWTGTQKSVKVGVVYRPSYQLTFDTALQRSDIDLPFPMHPFLTTLVTSRVGYAFNTRMFLDTLLQYNTDLRQFSANVRFDLIHRPLSDLFVVYNEQQLTNQPVPAGRGLIVKYTHMVAF